MSHTVAGEPGVVLRSDYVHVRALLLVAVAAIVGLTIAVVLLATNNGSTAGTPATHANSAVTSASAAAIRSNAVASTEAGATLNHSGRNLSAVQASSLTTGSSQVGPNPDQRDLIGSGSAFPSAGPNPDQATP